MFGQNFVSSSNQLCRIADIRGVPNRVHAEMDTAHFVKDNHVERCGRGAFLNKASCVEAIGLGPPMQNPVDYSRVAVEREDDRLVISEQPDEHFLIHAVWVPVGRTEAHQVYDVHYAHLELREMLP